MIRNALQRIRSFAQPKAVVLMYHRVAPPDLDVWNLAVSPNCFEEQLRVLRQTYSVISAEELVDQLQRKTLQRRSVVITFDDGYADNYAVAKPLLEYYQLPATFFIASGNLGKDKAFWSDDLAFILLRSKQLPPYFPGSVAGPEFELDLQTEQHLSAELLAKHQHWRAYQQLPPTLRATLYYRLWEFLKPMAHAPQQQYLNRILAWAGPTTASRADYCSMGAAQLRDMSSHQMVTIGAHTVTHPALISHPTPVQRQELRASKEALSQITGKAVNLLAYPYGSYNKETIDVAYSLGFDAAFTTEARATTAQTDPFRIARFQVINWNGPTFTWHLKQWFNP